ncbi:cytochrome P450 [Thozetella sp. PMI_491]|nr:cytochrome P450 [Thozetella sp. PMI_491]
MASLIEPKILAFFVISLSTAVFFVTRLSTAWKNARTAERLGCKPPPKFPTSWPARIWLLVELLAADRKLRLPEFFRERLRYLGEDVLTCSFLLGPCEGFFTCDEEIIQTVLSKNFDDFEIPQARGDAVFPLLGSGIFTQNGKAWRRSRAMLRPAFLRNQAGDLEFEAKHVENLMRCLPIAESRGRWTEEVDLQVLFFRYTLDSSAEYLFGGAVDSQLRHLGVGHEKTGISNTIDFGVAFGEAMEGIALRLKCFDLGKFVWPAGLSKACKDCHQFVDDYLQQQLCRLACSGQEAKKKGQYLYLEGLAAEINDPIELRSQILNIFLAGRDTTAGVLSWIFYFLARDPARYQKLREVVTRDLGSFGDKPAFGLDELKTCYYLKYVVDEVLRLYPTLPLNSRIAIRDTVLPRGGGPNGKARIFVPKGFQVVYSTYDLQRRTQIWGEDADEFVPERWEGRKVGWEYLPFNGGPRVCLGQQLALTKLAYVTARLVQKFDKIENLDPEPVQHKVTPTISSGTGVRVRLHVAA